jgi:hypothetical protein
MSFGKILQREHSEMEESWYIASVVVYAAFQIIKSLTILKIRKSFLTKGEFFSVVHYCVRNSRNQSELYKSAVLDLRFSQLSLRCPP